MTDHLLSLASNMLAGLSNLAADCGRSAGRAEFYKIRKIPAAAGMRC
jgi:hypothetical protein